MKRVLGALFCLITAALALGAIWSDAYRWKLTATCIGSLIITAVIAESDE